jgi:NAD+ kinase
MSHGQSGLRLGLVHSDAPIARDGAAELHSRYEFVDPRQADMLIALGGDGFMLQTLHAMLDHGRIIPVFGMNRGTVGFLMNEWRLDALQDRLKRALSFAVAPLSAHIETCSGERHVLPAINELSLLRETRQTAKIEILVDGRCMLPELVCDGVLVATPAGSSAYNLSANGPILPLDSAMLAITPISPFRPRRWRGAIVPDRTRVSFVVREATKRPISAVADQREVRDVARVDVAIDRTRALTLMFDPEQALDERIAREQFVG